MKKAKQYAYYRISYSKKKDAYSTWIYVGEKKYPDWDDFGMEMECRLVYAAGHEDAYEPEFVHYELLTHIRQAMRFGYEINWLDRPE